MNRFNPYFKAGIFGFTYAFTSLTPVWADDIEVYFNTPAATVSASKPNILFVFDTSPSFEGNVAGSNPEVSRTDAAKTALKSFIQSHGSQVNVGVARYNNASAAIVFPVADVAAPLSSIDPTPITTNPPANSTVSSGSDDGIQIGTAVTLTQTTPFNLNAGTANSMVGLRFRDIQIPRNAVITSAKLVFKSQAISTGSGNYIIEGERAGKSLDFAATANNFSSRTKTTATANWTPATWSTANSNFDSLPISPSGDLSAVIQEIVAQNDWCGGRALNLFIRPNSGNTGLHKLLAQESSNNAAQLQITYTDTPSGQSTCMLRTLNPTAVVPTANDDAYEVNDSSGSVQNTYDYLKLYSGHINAVRFTGLRLPEADMIEEAYLELVAESDFSSATTLAISAQLSTAPLGFTGTDKELSTGRTYSTGIPWVLTSWANDTSYKSPNITAAIQAARNSTAPSAWTNPGALVLRITHSSGANRKAHAYDESPAWAAKLSIIYRDEGTGSLEKTVGDALISAFDQMVGRAESLMRLAFWEALTYYRGENVYAGTRRGVGGTTNTKAAGRVSHQYSLVPGSYEFNTTALSCSPSDYNNENCAEEINTVGGKIPRYQSPITSANSCGGNHIVLVTDNGKDGTGVDEATIRAKIGLSGDCRSGVPSGPSFGNNKCIAEAAHWLNTTDQSSTLPGTQTVTTHVVLWDGAPLDTEIDELKYIAEQGGGQLLLANTAVELSTAFGGIARTALVDNSTFVAPSAPVNAINRLYNLDELYFSVFQPTKTAHWPGNLKKYKFSLTPGANPDDLATVTIVGANDDPAVYSSGVNAGKFKEDALSYWTPVTDADGAEVTAGGAANLMNYATRKVLTYTGSYTGTNGTTPSLPALTNSANLFTTANTALTDALLDVSATERDTLINWSRGKDGDTTNTRHVIGDPLHSAPVAVTYSVTPASGATPATQNSIIFMSTNAGFLHAINATTGVEKFAFIPKELLNNLDDQRSTAETETHIYGLDSTIKTWIYDADRDGNIESGDHVNLFFGMRRGGKNYYALDATNPDAPVLKWVIQGGVTTGFEKMGQSWAEPLLSRIKYTVAGVPVIKNVLILSGGYDPAQDNKNTRSADTIGRAIYIVDAQTGKKIWSGGVEAANFTQTFSQMNYSITASPAGIDMNRDGFVDQLYVGDLGGQVWRFDISNGESLANLVTGGVIADLGVGSSGINTAANNRRFYHSPEVSLSRDSNNQLSLSVLLGSGYREHPLLKTTNDRFYRIKQTNVYDKKTSYSTAITETDLYDATTDNIGALTTNAQRTALISLESKSGWLIKLPEGTGEKVMSAANAVDGKIHFSTYEPIVANACTAELGTNRSWTVDINTAAGTNGWTDVAGGARYKTSSGVNFIDRPTTIVAPDGSVIGISNPTLLEDTGKNIGDGLEKTYWH